MVAGLAVSGVLLAAAGAVISGYLAIENLQGDTGVCVGVHGCATVQDSRYGKLLGVPVSIPGLALYLALIGLAVAWWLDWHGQSQWLALGGFLAAFAGVAFSAYLTWMPGARTALHRHSF
jgi:uncharacterized membrane protein